MCIIYLIYFYHIFLLIMMLNLSRRIFLKCQIFINFANVKYITVKKKPKYIKCQNCVLIYVQRSAGSSLWEGVVISFFFLFFFFFFMFNLDFSSFPPFHYPINSNQLNYSISREQIFYGHNLKYKYLDTIT